MPNDKQRGGWKILKIVETDTQKDVFLEARIALMNATDPLQPLDMWRFGRAVERSVKLCFEVSFVDVDLVHPTQPRSYLDNYSYMNRVPVRVFKRYKTHVTVVWRVITSEASRSKEHVIKIVNASELPAADGKGSVYGRGTINGSDVKINANYVSGILSGHDRNTIPHELGHTLGLLHIDVNTHRYKFFGYESDQYLTPDRQIADSNNVMFNGRSPFMKDSLSTDFSPTQIRRIVKNLQQGTVNR